MHRTSLRFAALALSAGLLGAACSSSDSADTSPAPGATAAAGQATATVLNFAFDPIDLEVPVGTTVTWTNEDRFGHTVTSGTPDSPTGEYELVLGELTDGDTSGMTGSQTYETAGTFEYFCRYHPNMVGTVIVT